MFQEKEIKAYVKEKIEKLLTILENKKIRRGKLLQDEEIIYQSLKNPFKGDIKLLVVIDNNKTHIFIEDKRHVDSYFVIMNDKEANSYSARRAVDYYSFTNIPEENYNIYLISQQDNREIIQNPKFQKIKFYSIELGLVDVNFSEVPKSEIDINANIDSLDWDQKWELFKKLSDYDPRKKELMKDLFGFNLRFKKYKMPEDLYYFIIEPMRIREIVGMVVRDIYPVNLRVVLRRDYIKEHNELVKYAKSVLEELKEQVEIKKNNFKNSSDYMLYLSKIEEEIQYQINQLLI